jgi:hypothetical protein
VFDDYRPLLEEKGFRVEIRPTDETVFADRRGLCFLLGQVVSNSVKYALEKPVLTFSLESNDTATVLSIRDNGPGVRACDLPYVFEKGFTGDSGHEKNKATGMGLYLAREVAKDLGIDEVHAGLLPADKVAWVEKLLAQKPEKKELAFVGDGINDAPVLMRADIGIAMGALGSDAAIEAADIVLMDDDPAKISLAMRISRKCMRIVYQNIVFALAVKALCLILSALGITNMWWGVFADVGVMILAVLNATRMLNVKEYR